MSAIKESKPLAKVASLDLLFGGGDGTAEQIIMLPIDQLKEYPNQPFRPYSDEKLRELADDIAFNGILSPVCVRHQGADYQILAGHNRTNAAKLAGLSEVPSIIKECDDDTAALIVVNSNLNQREELLPSEKAFAYKMQLAAIRKVGATNGRTSSLLVERTGENIRNIQRYIRLTHLCDEMLKKVDDGSIPFRAGVNLSYITPDEQQLLLSFMREYSITTISLNQSECIKNIPNLNEHAFIEVFNLVSTKKESHGKVGKLSKGILKKHFYESAYSDEEISDILDSLLKRYFNGEFD